MSQEEEISKAPKCEESPLRNAHARVYCRICGTDYWRLVTPTGPHCEACNASQRWIEAREAKKLQTEYNYRKGFQGFE
jgi:hypothetical protein